MPKIFSVNVSFPKEVEFEIARTHDDFSYSISKALTNYLTTLTFFIPCPVVLPLKMTYCAIYLD
jgi:hypothetical protein